MAKEGPGKIAPRQDDIKRMTIKEFREIGYLQEINRRLLHPLGLALEVTILPDGNEVIMGAWDYREDPEGINYGPGTIDPLKATFIYAEEDRREGTRKLKLGYIIQPVDQ